MLICERCGSVHDGSFGSGRFCSRSCSSARDHSIETKQRIRTSVLKYNLEHGIFPKPIVKKERYTAELRQKLSEKCSESVIRRNSLKSETGCSTKYELLAFNYLKSLGYIVIPQKAFGRGKGSRGGPYIVDLYLPELLIAIEIDGSSHFKSAFGQSASERIMHDSVRDAFIKSMHHVTVLRFRNEDISTDISCLKESIDSFIKS